MNDEEPRQLPTAFFVEALTLAATVLGGAKAGKELLDSLGSRIDPAKPLRYAVQTCELRAGHILIRVQIRSSGELGAHGQSRATEATREAGILEVRDVTGRGAEVGFKMSADSDSPQLGDRLFLAPRGARLLE